MKSSLVSLKAFIVAGLTFHAALLQPACALVPPPPDPVTVILLDGEIRQDWPDRGVVGFHRQHTDSPLVVNYTLGGTAIAGVDFQTPPSATITIPAGDREAWLEFAPTGQTMSKLTKTLTVTLADGTGYSIPIPRAQHTATLTLSNGSMKPGRKAAVRFLNQAGFGPYAGLANVGEVMSKGYEGWINDQLRRPIGLQQPYVDTLVRAYARSNPGQQTGGLPEWKMRSWWRRAMATGVTADPLRQRLALALSEIYVISDHHDTLIDQSRGMMNFYDVLLKGAFGNYRTLLYDVATHPCMGTYLNHLGNEKGNLADGTFADENFAREVMQLFSIGLWSLNPDGSRKLDAQNKPISNYNNAVIEDMAKVMTGFGFGGAGADDFYWAPDDFTAPMRIWDEFHDVSAKTLLNGVTLPARTATADPDTGAAGMADLNAAIDMLFNHPSCPPFICKQLIQKLVSSNPSAGYVERVSAKFVNNGSGIRGDMAAVVRAILLDPEARDPQLIGLASSGKMKEPYLRTVNLARAFKARAANGLFDMAQDRLLERIHFQEPMAAPTVFNFFKPGYSPAGPVNDAGLVAPEFQIHNTVSATSIPNYYYQALQEGLNPDVNTARELVRPVLTPELALVHDVPALMRHLDLLLTGGTLPNEQHQVIREAVEAITPDFWDWRRERVRMAVYLITTSPEFGILR